MTKQKALHDLKRFEIVNMPLVNILPQENEAGWSMLKTLQELRVVSDDVPRSVRGSFAATLNNTLAQTAQLKCLRLEMFNVPALDTPLRISNGQSGVMTTIELGHIKIHAKDFNRLLRDNKTSIKTMKLLRIKLLSASWAEVLIHIARLKKLEELKFRVMGYDPESPETRDYVQYRAYFPELWACIESVDCDFDMINRVEDLHALGELCRSIASHEMNVDHNLKNLIGFATLISPEDVRRYPARLRRCENGKKYVLCETLNNERTHEITLALLKKTYL